MNKDNLRHNDSSLKNILNRVFIALVMGILLVAVYGCGNSRTKTTAVVNTASLNVREKPDLNSSKLGVLVAGESVDIRNQLDGWSEIEYKGAKGYVVSSYLSGGEESVKSIPKNKAERKAKNTKEIGRFTQDKKNPSNYYAYTKGGYVRICIPEDAHDVSFEESTLSFHLRTKWADVLFEYEINDSLNDRFDTERKIDSITDNITYSKESLEDSSFEYIFRYIRRANENGGGNPTAWMKKVGANGASYFFTGPRERDGSPFLATLYEEAFNYYDGITIHEKAEVRCMDFDTYKNKLDTTMAQNEAEDEFASFAEALDIDITSYQDDEEAEYTNSMYEFIELFKLRKKIDNR